jgi:alkyldihydroxyacetonephosphate synthase
MSNAMERRARTWQAEVGPVGVDLLRAVKPHLDTQGVLNPGVLLPASE